jgi:hypothetical protein
MVLLLETKEEKSSWKVKEFVPRRSAFRRQWNAVATKLQK